MLNGREWLCRLRNHVTVYAEDCLMQNKYRVCVIGCGVIAPNHIKPLLENEKTELVAVCDVLEDRARDRAELGKCAYYTD